MCKTDFIVCFDSDDILADDAIDGMYSDIDIMKNQDDVCGVVTKRARLDGTPFQENWVDEDYKKIKFDDLARVYGYNKDTCLLFKTNIIKEYHFPKFEGENFVTECIFYDQFMDKYFMIASPKIYYLAEYQPDGYTVQGIKVFLKTLKDIYILQNKSCIMLEKTNIQ